MQKKTLSQTNLHIRDPHKARSRLIHSLASSTAIETGESIKSIGTRLALKHGLRFPVTLA